MRRARATCSWGTPAWEALGAEPSDVFSHGTTGPPMCAGLPTSTAWVAVPDAPVPIEGARVLALLGDFITTDHISPAGSIAADSPAARYLQEHGVALADFNTYGSRRGNHEVMMRGTFANVKLAKPAGRREEGRLDARLPFGRRASALRCVRALCAGAGASRGGGRQDVRQRVVARLGGEGPGAPGHPRRARRKLRAHPSVEPHRHGHPALAVP